MKRKILAGVTVALTTLGGAATFTPTPASAYACGTGNICMWEDANYTGDRYVSIRGRPGTYDIDGWNGDNEITSVANATGMWVVLYADDECTDYLWTIRPNTSNPQLPGSANDDAECFQAYWGSSS